MSRHPQGLRPRQRRGTSTTSESRKETQVKNEIIAWLGATATVLAAGLAGYLLALVTPAW